VSAWLADSVWSLEIFMKHVEFSLNFILLFLRAIIRLAILKQKESLFYFMTRTGNLFIWKLFWIRNLAYLFKDHNHKNLNW